MTNSRNTKCAPLSGTTTRGTLADLDRVVSRHDIGAVVVAIQSDPGTLVQTVNEQCDGLEIEVKVLPEIFGPRVSIRDVRDIDVADVLGRGAIETDVDSIALYLAGKRVLERCPTEGVKTNVLGTVNALRAEQAVGVERFVNISAGKAADPVNVLGMSKRVGERLTASYAREASGDFHSARFGNVLGSRGSVLTGWAAQIAQGGPVTVTGPDVTRYFMTIPEARQFVIQAGAIGSGGETLILDMGEPVRLDDVARKLIEQSGQDIQIKYTGLRKGEKLQEVLRSESEADHRPHHELISHVSVSSLPARAVAGAALPEDPSLSKALLQQWCASEVAPMTQPLVRIADRMGAR